MAKIDITKLVKCTDLGKAYDLNHRMTKYNSPENNAAAKHDGCIGIQELMVKIQKIYGLNVCSDKWYNEDKSFDLHVTASGEIVEVRHFSYESICKEMWWHSFEVIAGDTIRPVPYTYDERIAAYKKIDEELAAKKAAQETDTKEIQEETK